MQGPSALFCVQASTAFRINPPHRDHSTVKAYWWMINAFAKWGVGGYLCFKGPKYFIQLSWFDVKPVQVKCESLWRRNMNQSCNSVNGSIPQMARLVIPGNPTTLLHPPVLYRCLFLPYLSCAAETCMLEVIIIWSPLVRPDHILPLFSLYMTAHTKTHVSHAHRFILNDESCVRT